MNKIPTTRLLYLVSGFFVGGGIILSSSTVSSQEYVYSERLQDDEVGIICDLRDDFWTHFTKEEQQAYVWSVETEMCSRPAGLSFVTPRQRLLQEDIEVLTNGFPIHEMADELALYDRRVAAMVVGIGKKESQWGKYSPSIDGINCYNYWGLKGQGERGSTRGGYACYQTHEEAAHAVSKKVKKFVIDQGRSTPERMLVWKCGSTCEGHPPQNVAKWIQDVRGPFNTLVSSN